MQGQGPFFPLSGGYFLLFTNLLRWYQMGVCKRPSEHRQDALTDDDRMVHEIRSYRWALQRRKF